MNKKIILLLVFVLGFSSCFPSINNARKPKNNVMNWNAILSKVLPEKLKDVRLTSENDIAIFKKYGRSEIAGEKIYKENLNAYKQKIFNSYIIAHVNNNEKEDIILSCVNEKTSEYFLVILEKNKQYDLIKYFQFDNLFFITDANRGVITISFQAGTDWIETIIWNGGTYVVSEKDEMGP